MWLWSSCGSIASRVRPITTRDTDSTVLKQESRWLRMPKRPNPRRAGSGDIGGELEHGKPGYVRQAAIVGDEGPAPRAPFFPVCGPDPIPDGLPCSSPAACE